VALDVRFTPAPTPDVSLVLVVHGRVDLAEKTLRSLARCGGPSFEVIVVDNASPDDAGDRLMARFEGAELIRSATNLGYGTAVDLGALRATGRYLGALNTDLEFHPDWLRHLVNALDRDRSAGVAGPMLLGTGGDVQEAGVVLGPDGTGYGYGDLARPDATEVTFGRYVDYVSGAAMIIRRPVFDAVGGFDPIYGTGYYEDADLCFSARQVGFRTWYEPMARVKHLGQGSFDPDHRRRQVARNRPIFETRFRSQLEGRPPISRPPFDPHRDLILRDWWCPQRFLVAGPDGPTVASALQDRLPDSRVTLLDGGGEDGRIERVPSETTGNSLERWLEQRRFHYSAVVLADPPAARLARALGRSQPQARIVCDADAGRRVAAAVAGALAADGGR
jgi:GT2 family glycosyltransferase